MATRAAAGGAIRLAAGWAVQAELEDYRYSAQFSDSATGAQTSSNFQNDVVGSLGLAVPLGGR